MSNYLKISSWLKLYFDFFNTELHNRVHKWTRYDQKINPQGNFLKLIHTLHIDNIYYNHFHEGNNILKFVWDYFSQSQHNLVLVLAISWWQLLLNNFRKKKCKNINRQFNLETIFLHTDNKKVHNNELHVYFFMLSLRTIFTRLELFRDYSHREITFAFFIKCNMWMYLKRGYVRRWDETKSS